MKPLLLALLFLALVHPAQAASCGGGVNAVQVVPTAVVFGNYSGIGSEVNLNGAVAVSCTVVTTTLPSFTISLSAGGGSGSSFTPRKMTQSLGSNTLSYNLYTASNFSSVWGDGTGSTVTQSYSAGDNQTLKNFTVYGNVPRLQFPPAGTYSDSITVTVTY